MTEETLIINSQQKSADKLFNVSSLLHATDFPRQFFLTNTTSTHSANAGINPLVDAAAHIFTIMHTLKHSAQALELLQLQSELICEINDFQYHAKINNYSAEYLLISRYALCASLDDIIYHTAWGQEWANYSLLSAFNSAETKDSEYFFIILDRIVKEPGLYIDLMELMYLCLNLGFAGNYRGNKLSYQQLEKISDSLYKHIRAYRGEFNTALSPFPLRFSSNSNTAPHTPASPPIVMIIIATILTMLAIFSGLSYLQDALSTQAYHELLKVGNTETYAK